MPSGSVLPTLFTASELFWVGKICVHFVHRHATVKHVNSLDMNVLKKHVLYAPNYMFYLHNYTTTYYYTYYYTLFLCRLVQNTPSLHKLLHFCTNLHVFREGVSWWGRRG